jgi:formylglycine-generating enzyme required for sulfatase activity
MLLASNLKLILAAAAGFAAPLAITGTLPEGQRDIPALGDRPALISIMAHAPAYRVAGDFTRDGKAAEAPLKALKLSQPLEIMRHQVTAADYRRCVDDGVCRATVTARLDRPAVHVSWRDATTYAAWLSRRTGETYRLPTDEEWALAAGSRWKDDGIAVDDSDPSRRWLARYEREANLKSAEVDAETRPVGAFGANEHGLLDVAGNVWEWTNTCFLRAEIDAAGQVTGKQTMNCGVRVVEGQHRAYVTDFIRDARAGGCAAGVPPANLGFRLVVDRRANDLVVLSAARRLWLAVASWIST